MKDFEKMARELEGTSDYRILRRLSLAGSFLRAAGPEEKQFEGLYVDCEATGLDVEKDQVIELCLYPFKFTSDGRITDLADPLHYYSEPSIPISAEITRLTGITAEMVAGKRINIEEVELLLGRICLVVAHHAAYDRPMLERISPKFKEKLWGCSMSQVPWAEHGIAGKRLEYILASFGRFYEAHNAVTDCAAGLYAMQERLPGTEASALSHVLKATREKTYHVWATDAPFPPKGQANPLKARGYFWNPGEDGRPKAWHKEIPVADFESEEEFLKTRVYMRLLIPARFDLVTAMERFTVRG